MTKKTWYYGIDVFRIFAAILVIANHTSPLAGFSTTADFIVTRVFARLAVPFFLMVSGYFLLNKEKLSFERLVQFIKKTAIIYGISMLVYLPINVYNHQFSQPNLILNLLKEIFVTGTMYHLWYLPAAILGALIAYGLIKKFGHSDALVITSILFFIGLLGDSYFGLVKNIPLLKDFYGLVFTVADFTRNGLFFTPAFLTLGAFIASDDETRLTKLQSLLGFIVLLGLMTMEALFLNKVKLPHHDAMTICLIPTMYFLFKWLLHFKTSGKSRLSQISLVIYIIHPMVIVLIRMVAKVLKLQGLLVENQLVLFVLVSLISFMVAVLSIAFWLNRQHQKARG